MCVSSDGQEESSRDRPRQTQEGGGPEHHERAALLCPPLPGRQASIVSLSLISICPWMLCSPMTSQDYSGCGPLSCLGSIEEMFGCLCLRLITSVNIEKLFINRKVFERLSFRYHITEILGLLSTVAF